LLFSLARYGPLEESRKSAGCWPTALELSERRTPRISPTFLMS